jgi:Arrestin (or S-antigen), N-terminal domain
MGTSNSKYNRNGGIGIQLTKGVYQDGDCVTGNLYINVTIPITKSDLFLIFKGKEIINWEQKTSNKRPGRTWCFKVCHLKYPIYTFEHGLDQGGYTLPFTIALPSNIPGTFKSDYFTSYARIQYKITAKLFSLNSDRLRGEVPIHINQKFADYKTDISLYRQVRMSTWCCIQKGLLRLDAMHRQNTYSSSQAINLFVEIDNSNSKIPLKEIACGLFFTLMITNQNKVISIIKKSLMEVVFPVAVERGMVLKGDNALRFDFKLSSNSDILNNMHTTASPHITCSYTIETEARMVGSCMCRGEPPVLVSNINIAADEASNYQTFALPLAPLGWNPIMLDPVVLQYDPKYRVLDKNDEKFID